jgi:tryptophanyl-tRNA synthetase
VLTPRAGEDELTYARMLSGGFANQPPAYLREASRSHCTLAVTEAFAFSVNVQVFVLLPPLEHAPDQMTSRSLVALSLITVPVANAAEPLLPTATLIPVGVDVTRSPPRPVAVTVSVAVCA